jgi:hypothetical protein
MQDQKQAGKRHRRAGRGAGDRTGVVARPYVSSPTGTAYIRSPLPSGRAYIRSPLPLGEGQGEGFPCQTAGHRVPERAESLASVPLSQRKTGDLPRLATPRPRVSGITYAATLEKGHSIGLCATAKWATKWSDAVPDRPASAASSFRGTSPCNPASRPPQTRTHSPWPR